MIWNDGYCDMVVETENQTVGLGKFPQLIHAQTAKKLLALTGPSTLAVYFAPRSEKAHASCRSLLETEAMFRARRSLNDHTVAKLSYRSSSVLISCRT